MFNFEQAVWVLGVDDDFNNLHVSTRSMVRTPHLIESHLATIDQGAENTSAGFATIRNILSISCKVEACCVCRLASFLIPLPDGGQGG